MMGLGFRANRPLSILAERREEAGQGLSRMYPIKEAIFIGVEFQKRSSYKTLGYFSQC